MEMVVSEGTGGGGGKVFVSLDLDMSWERKREYYLEKCLRGQMWWALDMIKDPPFGSHGSPASTAAASNADSGIEPTPSALSSVNAPGVDQNDAYCNGENGLVATENCEGFVFCSNGKMMGSITKCSPGLTFDANMGICNWPSVTNLCGFEFCPNGFSGYVPFEECTKFYNCQAGKINGDIDSCPEGTLFDELSGICNWSSMVTCNTKAPTPLPTPKTTSPPTFQSVAANDPTPPSPTPPGNSSPLTPRPTFGSVVAKKPSVVAQALHASIATAVQADSTTILRFDPSDDAYVQEEQPRENFNDNYVVIDQNLRFDGLIRFYVQGINDRVISYVKLRLYVSNKSVFGGNFYACKTDWHEDVVTWDSAPSIISQKPLAIVQAVLEEEWIEVDVTGIVSKDGPVALRITSDSSDNVIYSSKENPNKNIPQLLVGVEPGALEERTTVLNTLKIGPTDDSFVFMTTANKNYGRHTDLKVDLDNGQKKTFLRFDFSRVNIDAIQKATLRLFATDSSPSGGTLIKTSETEWSENSITYNNAPVPDGILIGTLDEAVEGSWVEIDITQAITESGPLSICILGNHEDRAAYSSKEGLHSPEIGLELQEIVPTDGERMELLPTDDATIVLQQPNSNFGMNDKLQTDLRDGMRNFLLRFDASDIPQGQVDNAILRIYSQSQLPAFGGTFVEVSSKWNEQTVTWNNAPPSDGKVLGSIMEVEGGSWYDVDVTAAVIGGGPVSFRVSSPHSTVAEYGSKESNHKPRMIVQYSPPDPVPDGFQVLNPTDDASILMDKPLQSFGMDGQLKVDGDSGVYNSLLRFDLTSIEVGSITQATLRLYALDGSPSGGTFISTQETEWSQYTVNWNSAPVANGAILATLGEVTPYKWYDIDVTEIAKGGEPISIRIAPSHGNRCAYSSSEDVYGRVPQLMIKADLFEGME
jgi:hypothetical protein